MKEIIRKNGEYYSQIFRGLNLSLNAMESTVFEECTFIECNFSEASLRQCKFVDCEFSQCNLSNLTLKYSKFLSVDFDECKIIGVDWTTASWPSIVVGSQIKFYKCNISDSVFFGLDLSEIVIQDCKAHNVDFREGNFSESDFSLSDFNGSLFSQTTLSGTDFIEATNYNIDINFNTIRQAKFSRYEALSLLDGLDIIVVD